MERRRFSGGVLTKDLKRNSACFGTGDFSPTPPPPDFGITMDCANDCPFGTEYINETFVFNLSAAMYPRVGYYAIASDVLNVVLFFGGYDLNDPTIWYGDSVELYDPTQIATVELPLNTPLPEPTPSSATNTPYIREYQLLKSPLFSSDRTVFFFNTYEPVNSPNHWVVNLTTGDVQSISSVYSNWTSGLTDSGAIYVPFYNANSDYGFVVVTPTTSQYFNLADGNWYSVSEYSPIEERNKFLDGDVLYLPPLVGQQSVDIYHPFLNKAKTLVAWKSGSTYYVGQFDIFTDENGNARDPFGPFVNNYMLTWGTSFFAVSPTAIYADGTDTNPTAVGDALLAGMGNGNSVIDSYEILVDDSVIPPTSYERINSPFMEMCPIESGAPFAGLTSVEDEEAKGLVIPPSVEYTSTDKKRIIVAYFYCPDSIDGPAVFGFATPFKAPIYAF